MTLPVINAGDVILTADGSPISDGIRWFTRTRGEKPSLSSHAAIGYGPVENSEYVAVPHLCEAQWRVRIQASVPRLDNAGSVWVYRPLFLQPSDAHRIRAWCRAYEGRRYSLFKVGQQAIDGLIGKVWGEDVYFARALPFVSVSRYVICSWVVAYVYWKALDGFEFGKRPGVVTPDDLHDYCVEHPGEFELIYKRERAA